MFEGEKKVLASASTLVVGNFFKNYIHGAQGRKKCPEQTAL